MANAKPINWAYPFPGKGADIGPMQYLTHMAKADGGHYPTGENGLWHGGVHFDQGTAAVFDQASVRCIADGEVIAYRIDDSYPISEYSDAIPRIRRAPFSTGFVLVKHSLRPPQAQASSSEQSPPTLTLYSLYMHLQDWTGYRARPDLPRPEFWSGDTHMVDTRNGDLIVRAQATADAAELARLAKGTQVRVRSLPGEYHKLVAILGGTHTTLVPGDDGELPGYVASKYLSMQSEPQATDRVVVLDTPLPIKAGDLIGHPGSYQNHDGTTQPRLHLEVFSCDDVPGFIAQSRAWANRLPDDQKTLLKVYKGASKLIVHRDDLNADNPPRLSDSGSQIGVDLIIPQALLEGLPAANKIQVKTAVEGGATTSTTSWWRLDGLFADENGNSIDGWLAEQDLITPRHSPWEWPDFQCVEDTGSPLDKLAYAFNAKGILNTEEQHNYRAQISKTDGGPILALARLYDIVDADRDGVLTSSEIRAALTRPWHAQVLGQLITRYESEWFWKEEKWDELDKLMQHTPEGPNPQWVNEKERIKNLSWWSELAGKQGVNADGKVWHFHPMGLIDQFMPCPQVLISFDQMKQMFPDSTEAKREEVRDLFNRYANRFEINTPERISQFFAQIKAEVGHALVGNEESLWYSVQALKEKFKRYFDTYPAEAETLGYKRISLQQYNNLLPAAREPYSIRGQYAYSQLPQADEIAKRVYCCNSSTGSFALIQGGCEEGLMYKGKGFIQLTWKTNYEQVEKILEEKVPEEHIDIVSNPDQLIQTKFGLLSAMGFWEWKKLNDLVQSTTDSTNAITAIINLNTGSYEKRRNNFTAIYQVFQQ